MAHVLVTGATGCLGAEITAQLLAQGHSVLATGRDPAAGAKLRVLGARFVARDLCDPRPWAPLLAGVQSVHHCGALSSAWGAAAMFDRVNLQATRRLLAAAAQAEVGCFAFTSSPSIFADGHDHFDLTEAAPLPQRFATAYAASKAAAERAVLAADDPAGMRCVALRPRAIYGRGDRALMPRLLQAIRRGRVPMISGGQALIDLTHVRDAARAQILAATQAVASSGAAAAQVGGRAFHVTSGQSYRFAELVEVVADWTGLSPRRLHLPYGVAVALAGSLEAGHRLLRPAVEPVLTRQAVASLGRSLTLNIDAARQLLGYQPQVALQEGIRDYAR